MFPALREYGGVAHLGERYIRIVEVVSSSLIVSTKKALAFASAFFNEIRYAKYNYNVITDILLTCYANK